MYLVACKWSANGAVTYKKPMDYLSAPNPTSDEMDYAFAVLELSPTLVNYHWLEDATGSTKITIAYYADKDTFDQWNTSADHTAFLTKRATFLNNTSITLEIAQKEVTDESDAVDYTTANKLFS